MIMKKRLVLLFSSLVIVACMVIITTIRRKEKMADYNYTKRKETWWAYLIICNDYTLYF